jgi:hypothetical protein
MKPVSTNVRLLPEELKALKQLALEKDLSLSGLFRKMIAEHLERERVLSGKDWKNDPFFRIGDKPGRSGLRQVSREHDHYLYGRIREASRKRSKSS